MASLRKQRGHFLLLSDVKHEFELYVMMIVE